MTAITPLEFAHKKGTFGEHHKKDESDLLRISEVKNLTIIQIVQYKRSKVNIKDIKIESLEIPILSSGVTSDGDTRILWSAPRTWLIVSKKESIIETVSKSCNEKDFAITDISHSRAVLQIKGLQAKEVLKKGCPVNFNEFEKNNCAATIFHGIAVVIDMIDDSPLEFNLFVLRSFGESFYHSITDSALEEGYLGV